MPHFRQQMAHLRQTKALWSLKTTIYKAYGLAHRMLLCTAKAMQKPAIQDRWPNMTV